MFGILWSYIYWYLRPFIKWFLRHTTRLCELQRICYGEPFGASRALGVENSLRLSRCIKIKELIEKLNAASDNQQFKDDFERIMITQAVVVVLQVKRINPKIHPQFVDSFGSCVQQIWGYRQLLIEVEEMRTTLYDSENLMHEKKLLDLWNKLMPDEKLRMRVTKQWQDIGALL